MDENRICLNLKCEKRILRIKFKKALLTLPTKLNPISDEKNVV